MTESMTEKALAAGSCNCGTVSFTVGTPLRDVYVCHCSICRKSTGSGGMAVVVVPTEAMTIVSGQEAIQTWHKPAHDWLTNFCKHCGSPLPGKNDDKRSYVPVSLLDSGGDELTVAHHIFVNSKPRWEELGPTGTRHGNGFGSECDTL